MEKKKGPVRISDMDELMKEKTEREIEGTERRTSEWKEKKRKST